MGQLNKTTEKVNELLDKVDGMPSEVNDGKTPVLETGTTTTLNPGQQATSEVVANGTDDNGNPKYKLNFGIPKGYDGAGGSGGGGTADSVQWANVMNKPSWVNSATKPTYTASEVGALPASTTIPSNTSQLTNDSGFTTSASFKTVNGQSIVGSGNIVIEGGGGGDTPSAGGNVNVTNGSSLQAADYYAFNPSANGSLEGKFTTIPNASSTAEGLMSTTLFSKLNKMKEIVELPNEILSLTNESTSEEILELFGYKSNPAMLLQMTAAYFLYWSVYVESLGKPYIGNREVFINPFFDSDAISGYIEYSYIAEGGKLRTIRINGKQEGDSDSPTYSYSCEVTESGDDTYYLPNSVYSLTPTTSNIITVLSADVCAEIGDAIRAGKKIYLRSNGSFSYNIPVSIYAYNDLLDLSFYHTSVLGVKDYLVRITSSKVRHIYPGGYSLNVNLMFLSSSSSSDDISAAVGGESGLKNIIQAVKDGNRLVIRGDCPDPSLGEYITAYNTDVSVCSYMEDENGNMSLAIRYILYAVLAVHDTFCLIAYNKTENTFGIQITNLN